MAACKTKALDVTLLLGGPACGKTTALLQELQRMEATDDAPILFITTSESEVNAIVSHTESMAIPVTVTSIQNLAHTILAEPEAHAHIKRGPHVLTTIEEGILFEDMRSLGIKQRRLRGLVGFIERGWSDLADEDEGWLQTLEEEHIARRIRESLALSDSLLSCELEACALRAIRQSERVRATHSAPCVIADDFTLMGRAAQQLVASLATERLIVAADESASTPTGDPFPYADGAKELLEAHPHATVERIETCHRPAPIVTTLNAIRAEAGYDALESAEALDSSIATHFNGGFGDEQKAIVEEIERARNAGTPLSEIAIVGTNGIWRANLAKTLRACGIPTRAAAKRGKRIRDYRDAEANTPIERATLAQLARNPKDAAAWRTWCALGDYLANSVGIDAIRAAAMASGLTLPQALDALIEGTLPGVSVDDVMVAGLVARYRKGRAALEDAHEASVEKSKRIENEIDAVLVCAPEDVRGGAYELIVFGGFVNGFFPSRAWHDGETVGAARIREDARNHTLLANVVASCNRRLVFTGFTSCTLETAERLDLCVEKIKLRQGIRMATITPSSFCSLLPLI